MTSLFPHVSIATRVVSGKAADARTISYKALKRSRTTIEDFVKSYFPLHGLDPAQDVFKYLDILVFVEATIYQMDEDNEKVCAEGEQSDQHVLNGEQAILGVLENKGLLEQRLVDELAEGKQYWADERRLCKAMLSHSQVQTSSVTFDLADVHKTSEAKSFDYRVLNLLLYKLTRRPCDDILLGFLFVDEHLVDIGDDLVDYEDDVIANSFNIYRAYIHLYGKEAQIRLVKRIVDFEQQHANMLLRLPQQTQELVKLRQHEAASVAGSEKWVFPSAILDEGKYRADISLASSESE